MHKGLMKGSIKLGSAFFYVHFMDMTEKVLYELLTSHVTKSEKKFLKCLRNGITELRVKQEDNISVAQFRILQKKYNFHP